MRILAADLALLALDEVKGTFTGTIYGAREYGLCAAILMELVIEQRLAVVDDRLYLVRACATGHALHDEGLRIIQTLALPQPLACGISALATRLERLQSRIFAQLVAEGVIYRKQQRLLWLFSLQRYPSLRTAARARLVAQIRGLLLPEAPLDNRTRALLLLIEPCGFGPRLFPYGEWKLILAKLKDTSAQGDPLIRIGAALKQMYVEASVL